MYVCMTLSMMLSGSLVFCRKNCRIAIETLTGALPGAHARLIIRDGGLRCLALMTNWAAETDHNSGTAIKTGLIFERRMVGSVCMLLTR